MKQKQVGALFLGILLCLTSCVKAPVQKERTTKTLEVWYYWDSQTVQRNFRKMIQTFNNQHSDVEVVSKYVPDEDFKKQLALAIADGVMPAMAIVDSSDLLYFDSLEPLIDMSEIVDEDTYMDVAVDACRSEEGKIKGLPLGLNCLAFFYNEDLLEKANVKPPETLEEFALAATKLTSDKVYGCAFPSLQSEESIFCFLPILWGMGGSLDHINSENSRKAFDFLRQLSVQGAMSRDAVHMTLNDIEKAFVREELAMMFNASFVGPLLAEGNPKLRFKVAPIPTGDQKISVVGGEVLALMDTGDTAEAMEFARFMADPENMREYLDDLGYFSPRKDLLEWQAERDSYCRQCMGILETARPREFIPEWPKISMEITRVINQVILREDQEDTIEELEKKINKIRGGRP